MAIARQRFGKMHHIWGTNVVPFNAQLQLFDAGVVSVLVYGSESWLMDDALQASLKGWCARCVTHITGRSIADECRVPSFPLLLKIYKRRFKWLGHQLKRTGSTVQKVLMHMLQQD